MNAMIDSLPVTDSKFWAKLVNEEKSSKAIRSTVAELVKNALQICDLKSLNIILSTVAQGATATNGTNGTAVLEERRNGGKKIFVEEKPLARKASR